MSEENKINEESKKTVVAFIAGLLVGGLLVFIFVNPNSDDYRPSEGQNRNTDTEEVSETENDGSDRTDEDNTRDDSRTTEERTDNSESVVTGGSLSVSDQKAGSSVSFSNANFPTNEGWVGVREYQNGQLVGLLGVARWNKAEGLMPSSVTLLRPTVAGETYAIVLYSENGDKVFSLAKDSQVSGVMGTFEAE